MDAHSIFSKPHTSFYYTHQGQQNKDQPQHQEQQPVRAILRELLGVACTALGRHVPVDQHPRSGGRGGFQNRNTSQAVPGSLASGVENFQPSNKRPAMPRRQDWWPLGWRTSGKGASAARTGVTLLRRAITVLYLRL
ncbi:hypothetical protein diail_8930 [Diaporthe ilicicola]|nr:hypothetical protein diail_8930 [Diaporthe ilicicola]